jgi:alkanesulfonate monooxygenase SsuD/methylene tetrahydromethanopterin reductase-like flavin-dependent oxidoreductase (luciferase family)
MGAAELIACEEVRASKQWHTLRQQRHAMQVHEGSGRATPWVMALDSRAEMLLRYDSLFCDNVLQLSGKRNLAVRDFRHYTGRGRLETPWVGSPKDIADRLEERFTERACDGFVVGPTYLPGTFEEFVRLVIPESQRRGVYGKEYAGTTLRDYRRRARPEVGVSRH